MTTNNQGGSQSEPDELKVMSGSPFDIGQLANLANEMMKSLPENQQFKSFLESSGLETQNFHASPFAFLDESRPLVEAALAGSIAKATEASELYLKKELDDNYLLASAEKSLGDRVELAGKTLASAFAHGKNEYLQQKASMVSANMSSVESPIRADFPAEAAGSFLPIIISPTVVSKNLGSSALATGTGAGGAEAMPGQFNVEQIKRDFPILAEKIKGRDLVWLDNAATTQKPQAVIDRLSYFYSHENSNIHRAAHELAARSTDAYEASRRAVARFINAGKAEEIIFLRGATEGINFIAQSWGRQNIGENDEILISWLEHHANIVPWQMLAQEKGARLKVAPVDDDGQIILEQFEKLLGPRTKLVSFAQVSNALGTVTPLKEMIAASHRLGARVMLDGAQAISHMPIDVQDYDCDFYVFSGHKTFAPTGIGAVYAKEEILSGMPPWHGGGNMIHDVSFERTLYQDPPSRFEAGTGNIADAVGLAAAIEYLERIGMRNVARHESQLMDYATKSLSEISGLKIIGTAKEKAGVISFVLDGFKTEELSAALNQWGIAVRSGHHCAQPILRRFGLEASVRASFALYNNLSDIDKLASAILALKERKAAY